MTKIDPTPLMAEAQARETALKVALAKVDEAERRTARYRVVAMICALTVAYLAWWVLA